MGTAATKLPEPKIAAATADTPPVAQHKNVHEAIAALQAQLPAIARTTEGAVPTGKDSMRKFQYADLAAIWAVVRPLVGRHGLALRNALVRHERATPEDLERLGEWELQLFVTHAESGTEVVSSFPVWPRMSGAQGLAAATTFARRYALMLALGIVTEEEPDEDNIGHHAPPPSRAPQGRVPTQRRELTPEEQRAHSAKALENAGPPAQSEPEVTKQQLTVLWATAHARAKEIGDESITRETIVREVLRAHGLTSSKQIPPSQINQFVMAARRWSVPLPSDDVPVDEVPVEVDEAAAAEAFN